VRVRLRQPADVLFDGADTSNGNEFSFGLSPDVFIALTARAKVPGEAMVGEDVRLVDHRCRGDEMEPYERLIGDALHGDRTLFGSEAGVEAAWRVVNPILKNDEPLFEYDCGSWGPSEGSLAAPAADRINTTEGTARQTRSSGVITE
jgi:glucose-6-phosphate 1-dehydrogenase